MLKPIYRSLIILDRQRCREVSSYLSRKVSRKTTSIDAVVEKVSRNKAKTQEKNLDRSTSCREAIEDPKTFSIDPPSYRGSVEIAIRNNLRARQIARCKGGVELAFKISFSRGEKHKHECNQACNSTNDPISILSSQNHLSIKILSTWI